MTHTIHGRIKVMSGMDHIAELENVTNKIKRHYKESKNKVTELEAEVNRLKGVITNQDVKLKVIKRQKTDMELELRMMKKEHESLIVELRVENSALASRVKDNDIEILQAMREGKKEVIAFYNMVLGQIKEKFTKMKAQGDLKFEIQEIQANIVLLRDILAKEVTDLEKELEDLRGAIPQYLCL